MLYDLGGSITEKLTIDLLPVSVATNLVFEEYHHTHTHTHTHTTHTHTQALSGVGRGK